MPYVPHTINCWKPDWRIRQPLPIPHPETVAIWLAVGGQPAIDVIVKEAVVGPAGIGLARKWAAEVLFHPRFLVLLDDFLLFLLGCLSRFGRLSRPNLVNGHNRRSS